jgi:hypothetical protein
MANRNANTNNSAMPSGKTVLRIARTDGINDDSLRKARAFAREYDAAALDELCELRRPNGLPLHWGYIPYLLVAGSEARRKTLQRLAAKQGWTPSQLHAEIRRRRPNPVVRVGRPVKKPGSRREALEQLVASARLWLKRRELMRTSLAARRPEDFGVEDQHARRDAIAHLKRLAAEATSLAAQLEMKLPGAEKCRGAKNRRQ